MPRVQSLVSGLVMTAAMTHAMIMNPGQEKMIKNTDIDKIIESHGLDLSKSRPDRDLSNEITTAAQTAGLSLPPGTRMPTDIPEGFDLSSVEPQDDGQFCVFKKITLEGIEKIPVQQCVHKVDTQCYLSYITQYTPATEDVCSENYKKKCYIEYTKTSVTETLEKCIIPRERLCSPPQYGEVSHNVMRLISVLTHR